ncbi:MAG: endonuclease III domain-containing protein [Chloroflexota bacterium]
MGAEMDAKAPFDVDIALMRIADAVQPYPPAALFALADDGYASVFQQVAACMISIRTRDETTIVVARRLLERAGTPQLMLALSEEEIDSLIHAASFHTAKARQIRGIAERAVREFAGTLPCDSGVLLSLPGIGPKCANLVLGIACGQPSIAVDIHVHRITNRWGYVQASTPEATMPALEQALPRRHWITINRLLVPFGKHVCTGTLPHCSTCPVLAMCRQVGVTRHR